MGESKSAFPYNKELELANVGILHREILLSLNRFISNHNFCQLIIKM